jgi:hypothetical protein
MKRALFLAVSALVLACGGKAIVDGAGSGGAGGQPAQGGTGPVTSSSGQGGDACDCTEFCSVVDCAAPVCCLALDGQCRCVQSEADCACM